MSHLCTNGQTILSAFIRQIISASSLRDVADGPHFPLECDGRHKVIRICSAGSNTSHCVFLPYCQRTFLFWESEYLSRYSDSLWAGRSRDRIPVGARFSAPVQINPGAHTPSFTMGTGSFLGVKRPGRGVDHPPHLVPKLKKE